MSSPFAKGDIDASDTAPARQPAPEFEQADAFAAIGKLPGVVIYQRLVTPDGHIRYTYISEGARDLFGVSAEEIISNPDALFSCHSADYSAKFRERLLTASKSLTLWDVEASIISQEGRKKYTHAIARPERKSDGSVLWTGIILDETRTRTAFIENLTQGVLLYDAEDRLILRNNSFVDLYPSLRDVAVPGAQYEDVVRAELAGQPVSSLADPELFGSALQSEFHERIKKHQQPHSMYERPLEGDRWVLVNEHRLQEGTIVLFTDITEMKRRERQNNAKSAFLAMMSHEIRTPMNAVLGLASTLLDTDLDDEQRKSVNAIRDAGDNLLDLLNDILDFSKLEAGRISFEAIAFSPEALVDGAVSIVGPRAAAKSLSLRAIKESVLPPALTGDAGRIRQVVLNLLSNAVKFTEAGEVTISARCLARDDRYATIEWSISDTGIGIAPERIKDLFADFVQADNSISRRFGGTGLGLSISKRLVEQMGGEIKVVSALGKGSTFRFSLKLPIAEENALTAQDDNERIIADLRRRIAQLGRSLRILVVDDNATNRLIATKMLKDFDVQTNAACDGAEAVAAASQFSYDVILMDMRMPEMDGLQATRAIRARGGALAKVPIIAFTANAFPDDVLACREAGMTGFIVKPVRKKELLSAIVEALMSSSETRRAKPAVAQLRSKNAQTSFPIFEQATYDAMVKEIGEDGAREMVKVFLAETDRRIALLRRLSCEVDRTQIAREIHSLKGDAATLGLTQLAELARMIELEAESMTEGEYSVALDRIEPAFAAAREKLPNRAA
jgi:signal transduction histidine kinase/DNA-binding response OmpR family regulator